MGSWWVLGFSLCVRRGKFRYWCVEGVLPRFADVRFVFVYFLEIISFGWFPCRLIFVWWDGFVFKVFLTLR